MNRFLVLVAWYVLLACFPALYAQQTGIWVQQGIQFPQAFVRPIDCADSLHCMACGGSLFYDSGIYRTNDGGLHWDTVYYQGTIPGKFALGISFISYPAPGLALVAADSGIALRTVDSGRTWNRVQVIPGSKGWKGDVSMYDTLNGAFSSSPNYVVVYKQAEMALTTDGGVSWQEVTNFGPPGDTVFQIFRIKMISPATVTCIMASNSRYSYFARSTDRGRNWAWVRLDTIPPGYLVDSTNNGFYLDFTDSLNGWIMLTVRDGPRLMKTLYRTRDGGITWRFVSSGNTGIKDISFRDTLNGIAGTDGTILRTTDGGVNWRADSTPDIESYYVYYKRGTPGIAAGYSSRGRFYRYTKFISGISIDNQPAFSDSPILLWREPGINGGLCVRWVSNQPAQGRLLMYNSLGIVVQNVDIGMMGQNRVTIPLSGLPGGWYGLRLQTSSALYNKSFCLTR